MRIISMVPSWTETLLSLPEAANIEVVGRTRFCIHPHEQVKNIAVVGGTKKIDWDIVQSLKPELLILDREENPKSMSDESPIQVLDTHVTSLESLVGDLKKLADFLSCDDLHRMAERAKLALKKLDDGLNAGGIGDNLKLSRALPVELSLRALKHLTIESTWEAYVSEYFKSDGQPIEVNCLIWKDPWMSVSGKTFMGSILTHLGFKNRFENHGDKYPKIEAVELLEGLNFFTSEPYPFLQKKEELRKLQLQGIFVNGELLSWFGIRTIEFLEKLVEMKLDVT